jgi:hypothetical protein
MTVNISNTAYKVANVNEQIGSCTIVAALNNVTPTDLLFTWSLSDDLIRTGSLGIDEPKTGGRTRVRYTVFFFVFFFFFFLIFKLGAALDRVLPECIDRCSRGNT